MKIHPIATNPIIADDPPPKFGPVLVLVVVDFESPEEEDGEVEDPDEAGGAFDVALALVLASAPLKIFASAESGGRFSRATKKLKY